MEQWEATCAPPPPTPPPRLETAGSEPTSSVVASTSAATLEEEMRQIERETAAMLRETEAVTSPLEERLQPCDDGDDQAELSMEQIERETAAMLRETSESHPDSPLPPDGGVVSLEQLLADPSGGAVGPCSSEPDLGVVRLLEQPREASEEEHAHAAAAVSGGATAAAGLRELLFGRAGDKASSSTTTSDADTTVQCKDVQRTADDVRAKYGRPRQSELVEAAAEASERLAERGERIGNLMNVSERMERDAESMATAAKKLAENQKGWFGI